jgi:hypothetical protein
MKVCHPNIRIYWGTRPLFSWFFIKQKTIQSDLPVLSYLSCPVWYFMSSLIYHVPSDISCPVWSILSSLVLSCPVWFICLIYHVPSDISCPVWSILSSLVLSCPVWFICFLSDLSCPVWPCLFLNSFFHVLLALSFVWYSDSHSFSLALSFALLSESVERCSVFAYPVWPNLHWLSHRLLSVFLSALSLPVRSITVPVRR